MISTQNSFRLPVAFTLVSLWIGLVTGSAAQADPQPIVAYGNLGNSGTGGLGSTSTTTGTAQPFTQRLTQGFTTGTSIQSLSILSVTLGIASPVLEPGLRSVGIYGSVGGNPGSLLYTSSELYISENNRYSFAFPWSQLEANTAYWIVPSDPILWYSNSSNTQPAGRNGSGYLYAGTRQYGDDPEVTAGVNWYNAGTTSYAVSIVAIPEPSSLPLCIAGLGTVAALERV